MAERVDFASTLDSERGEMALVEARLLGTPWNDGGVVASTSVPVEFAGPGSGEDDLTWGQQDIWGTMQREQSWLPIGFARPLPAGTTVEDVANQLCFCMSRYQSMRTRLRFVDGRRPRQVVESSGVVTLEIVDAGPDTDPAEVAYRVQQRYQSTDHDHATQWPVRMAVVRHRGTVTHQVLVVCHLVVDGQGALVMLEELARRDPRADPMAMPVTALQPLEQARQQRTPGARRQSAAAMRHWMELLRGAPTGGFTGSGDPREPRYWEVGFNSRALHLAVGPVAARAGVETSPVLLAAFAMAMSKVTGVDALLIELVVGNRFRRDLERSVSPVIQTGLCLLDVAGVDFNEAVDRAWRASLSGYKHGYYDPAELAELTDRLPHGQAEARRNRCGFNDRRMLTSAPTPPDPTPEQLRAALTAGRLNVERRQDRPFEPGYLHVLQLPEAIRLVLCFDTHLLGPADQEAVLRAVESTVVDAALRAKR